MRAKNSGCLRKDIGARTEVGVVRESSHCGIGFGTLFWKGAKGTSEADRGPCGKLRK